MCYSHYTRKSLLSWAYDGVERKDLARRFLEVVAEGQKPAADHRRTATRSPDSTRFSPEAMTAVHVKTVIKKTR